jgi:hypothetical protein
VQRTSDQFSSGGSVAVDQHHLQHTAAT